MNLNHARFLGFVLGLAVVMLAASCRVLEPSNRPLDACHNACEKRASKACTEHECTRGCELILDRIAENLGDEVIACVATRERHCSDAVWAECAARVGPHADGGPPGPPPPVEDE
jgi:hypothetical protein